MTIYCKKLPNFTRFCANLSHKFNHCINNRTQLLIKNFKLDILASGSFDNTTIIWNGSTGEKIHVLLNTAGVTSLQKLPSGLLAAGLEDGSIALWNITSGELVKTLKEHSEPIVAMTILGKLRHDLKTSHGIF